MNGLKIKIKFSVGGWVSEMGSQEEEEKFSISLIENFIISNY